jgi:hypothetical protein
MEVLAMKPAADFVQNERAAVSELAALSRDPALTFRPDPTFRAQFRNADEIIEDGFEGIDASARPVFIAPPRWTYPALWRRCPKE